MLRNTLNYIFDKKVSVKFPPIFVVGCGHSGTTLLATLLGRSEEYYLITQETYIFENRWLVWDIKRAVVGWEADAGKRRWVEKTPRHINHMDRIKRVFPTSQVIALVRNGFDVVASMKRRGISPRTAADRWIADMEQLQRWRAHPDIHIIYYEDLVLTPESVLRKLGGFLGATTDLSALLKISTDISWNYSGSRDISTDSQKERLRRRAHLERRNTQVNKPIYNDIGNSRRLLDEKEMASLKALFDKKFAAWGYDKLGNRNE